MKIFISGCAGFIGSHLSERLLLDNHEIYGIDILNNYYNINQKINNLEILKILKFYLVKIILLIQN